MPSGGCTVCRAKPEVCVGVNLVLILLGVCAVCSSEPEVQAGSNYI